ncbi:hypothetical protein STPH2_1843 [Streptomyces sp. KO7888]|nr:hypothetical protein [Streptomyces sp. KO7888]
MHWRAFVYDHRQDWRDRSTDRARAAYDHFVPLDGEFAANAVLQVKHGPMDFQVREPVSPLIGAMPGTRLAVEAQATQEYTGQQRHVCWLGPMWSEVLCFRPDGEVPVGRLADALVAVSNVGDDTPDPHADAPGGPGPAARGLLDPHDHHYRRLITDAVRAVAAVRALPGVDPARVAAVGNSQGGGLALAVAGLVPDLAAVLVSAPLLCGIRRALDLTDAGPYGEIAAYLSVHRGAERAAYRTLSYLEGVSFARRAHAPAHFGVGLRGTVCPPSGAYAAFNRYGELSGAVPRKEIHAYPFNGHEGGDAVHVRRQLGWLAGVRATD